MSEDRELDAFAKRINAEIKDRAFAASSERLPDFKENVFVDVFLEYLAEVGAADNPEVCHWDAKWGRASIKINGISIGDDGDSLELFSSVFMDRAFLVTAPRESIVQAAEKARRFFEAAKSGLDRKVDPALDIHSVAERVREISPRLSQIRIVVLTDGRYPARKKIDLESVDGIDVVCDVWDLERLFRATQSGVPRDSIEFDFEVALGACVPCVEMKGVGEEYDAFLAILPGEALFQMYETFGSRLLEYNVRAFLQAKGNVNRGIRESLRSESGRFLAYNNGISATAERVEVVRLPDGQAAIKALSGFQVVNGGQTTASIHRARKSDKIDLSSVFVPAKICVIANDKIEEFVPRISRFANTQNVIQMADFSANDPYHVEIERLSRTVWCPGEQGIWFYERARGQYQVEKSKATGTDARKKAFLERIPPSRKFTKVDLAKYLNSWDQQPQVVSRGGQKNFASFMQEIDGKVRRGWRPDEDYYKALVAKAILFRSVQRIVRQEQLPAYQANVVTYSVAYLSWRCGGGMKFQWVWQNQHLSRELEVLLRGWAREVSSAILQSAKGRNVTEWCKKDDCWEAIRSMELSLPDKLPAEIAEHAGESNLLEQNTTEDRRNITACMEVPGDIWLKIRGWGVSSGVLDKKQCGIALTFYGMAEDNWPKPPSKKQAWHGVRILEEAERHGVVKQKVVQGP